MFWQDEEQRLDATAGDAVSDLSFRIRCRTLPVEHAWPLSQAIEALLPWFATEPAAGLHLIHVTEAGNGWMRPEASPGEIMHLSRRARLTLRLPSARLEQARALCGRMLEVDGHELAVGEATPRPLAPSATLFARHVAFAPQASEEEFLGWVAARLGELGVTPRKLLGGRARTLSTPRGPVHTRSVMIADLRAEESVRVQQAEFGPHRRLGCGLFVAHKGIAPVGKNEGE